MLLGMPLRVSAQDTAAPKPAPVLNDDQMFKKYVVSTVGPAGLIGAAAAAAYEQDQNYPAEWRQTAPGYAKRFASAYAAGAIGNSTKYAIAHLLHQDPSFTRCQCTGFNRRMRHAVTSVFTARTQTGRERVLAGHGWRLCRGARRPGGALVSSRIAFGRKALGLARGEHRVQDRHQYLP